MSDLQVRDAWHVVLAALFLALGIVVYWELRPDIILFSVAGFGAAKELAADPGPRAAAGVIRNHLSDALWCLALLQTFMFLKANGCPRRYLATLLALPFASEALQATGFAPGTFDWLDVLVYLALFLCHFIGEISFMLKHNAHLAGCAALLVFVAGVVGSGGSKETVVPATYENASIQLDATPDDVFTKPSLGQILRRGGATSIVLRVPAPPKDITQEQIALNTTLYNTIELAFARAGYVVRDRALFQRVLDQETSGQQTLDYSRIGQLTDTDLILELLSFRDVPYQAGYTDESGARQGEPRFSITGARVEFRLVSIGLNDIVGSYVFNYTPCVATCIQRFSKTVPSTWTLARNVPTTFFDDSATKLVRELASVR